MSPLQTKKNNANKKPLEISKDFVLGHHFLVVQKFLSPIINRFRGLLCPLSFIQTSGSTEMLWPLPRVITPMLKKSTLSWKNLDIWKVPFAHFVLV